jgi:anti-sigma-K factor RskA
MIPWAIAACFVISTGALWMERNALQKDRAALIEELHSAKGRDNLTKIKVTALSPQVDTYAKATAVVAWDADQQRGILKLTNVPKPESGKDYQLWIMDPKYPKPISAGVIPVEAEGVARVPFQPEKQISKAENFAISVEQAGGAPEAQGPIILLGSK